MALTPRVLVFSPALGGHRQVYCRVFADVLHEAGCGVVVAGAFGALETAERAALEHALRRRGPAEVVDTAGLPQGGRGVDPATFSRLVREQRADVTVFAEADDHLRLLTRQLAPGRRIPGRRVGVFLRGPRYIHAGRDPDPWRNRLGRWRRGRVAWTTDPYVFHEHLLPRFPLLDAALCLDEVFVERHGGPYQWLPDIFASFDPQDWEIGAEESAWLERLREFCSGGHESRVLVYYGTAQARRGYAVLLRLAVDLDAGFVHCGARPAAADADGGAARAREELARRNALFETGAYLPGYGVAREFMRVAPCAVLPYSRHHVSSGVMLQALDAGRPVVVPFPGLMAWRTRRFGLGRTFAEGSYDDLRREAERALAESPAACAPRLDAFMKYFERDRVAAALRHALGLGGAPAPTPAGAGARHTERS